MSRGNPVSHNSAPQQSLQQRSPPASSMSVGHDDGASLYDRYISHCAELFCRPNSKFCDDLLSLGRCSNTNARSLSAAAASREEDDDVVFNFSRNVIGTKGLLPVLKCVAAAAAAGGCCWVQRLILSENSLGNASCAIIADCLHGHPSLTHVDLSGNPISRDGAKVLLKWCITVPRLRDVDLSHTLISRSLADQILAACGGLLPLPTAAAACPDQRRDSGDIASAPVMCGTAESPESGAIIGIDSLPRCDDERLQPEPKKVLPDTEMCQAHNRLRRRKKRQPRDTLELTAAEYFFPSLHCLGVCWQDDFSADSGCINAAASPLGVVLRVANSAKHRVQ